MSFSFPHFGRPVALATAIAFAAATGAQAAPLPVPSPGLSAPDAHLLDVSTKGKKKVVRRAGRNRGVAIGVGAAIGILGAAAAAAAARPGYYEEDDGYYAPPPPPRYYGAPYGYQRQYYGNPTYAPPPQPAYRQPRQVWQGRPNGPQPGGWGPSPGYGGRAPVCNGCGTPLYPVNPEPGRGP